MSRSENTIWCDNCGAEIFWGPVIRGKRDYCCQDCFEGRGCDCGERMDEFEKDRRAKMLIEGRLPIDAYL